MKNTQILLNKLYSLPKLETTSAETYRVVAIYPETKQVALFPVVDEKKLLRPKLFRVSDILRHLKKVDVDEVLPMLVQTGSEDNLSESQRSKRDKNYNLIQSLVESNYDELVFELCTIKKSRTLKDHANKLQVDVTKIYRLLNRYWFYGQTKNALLPHYFNSGSNGKERKDSELKRGRPIASYSGLIEFEQGRSVNSKDKSIFRRYIKNYINIPDPFSVAETYRQMIDLESCYADEVRKAENTDSKANIPTLVQFRYWEKKLNAKSTKLDTQGPAYKRKQVNRDSTKGSSALSSLPGESFQIDATIADVYVVYPFDRSKVLGRPCIYSVSDTATRMIVGLYVTLGEPSWQSAKHVLFNTFTSKVSYCSRFGLEITEKDWPSHHAPKELICDRGEMIGLTPEKNLPLCTLRFTGSGRPEMKGIVERTFGIYNQVLHKLKGTTKGQRNTRMDANPASTAMYTLEEVTKQLIIKVLDQNSKINKDVKNLKLILESGVKATPLNAWKLYISKHKHSLKVFNEQQVLANLLKPVKASVTEYGYEYADLYYTSTDAEREQVFTLTKRFGEYQVEARINPDDTSYIFVRLDNQSSFVKCVLTARVKELSNLTTLEYNYLRDIRKTHEINGGASVQRANLSKESQKIRKRATIERKVSAEKNNITDIRERKKIAAKAEESVFKPDTKNERIKQPELKRNNVESNDNIASILRVRPKRNSDHEG